MITRHSHAASTLLLLAGLSATSVACQKVPLLAPSGSVITLTALATALPANGTTDIIGQVIEPSGTPPHSGTHVTFSTTLGTIQPSEAQTDINGRVVVKFVAGSASGTATIIAISGGVSAGTTGAVKIAVGSAAVGHVGIAANPTTVPSTGGTTTINSNVLDSNGNVLNSVPVTFTTTAGTLSASVVITDANGNAQTTLTTNRQATVTATAGVTTPTGTTGTGGTTTGGTSASSATIIINVNAISTITVGTPSPASPTVGQTVTFPLTISPNANGSPVQRVIVDWGDGSASETFQGSPTAVSHAYNSPGTYGMRATAVDALGDIGTGSASVTVGARPQPLVTIAASPNSTAGTPTTFTVTANPAPGSNTTIQNVSLNFGDGTPAVNLGAATGTSTAQHVYQTGGTYTATATARDSNGGTAPASTVIFVQDQTPLSVSITFTQAPAGGSTIVSFTATVSPTTTVVSNYLWEFGDGTTLNTTGNQTTHSYVAGSGAKLVRVTVTTTQGRQASGSTTVIP